MPSSCGGVRSEASISSPVTLLMPVNSSFAATSLTGISFRPSLLPPGECRNRLRKLPGPRDSRSLGNYKGRPMGGPLRSAGRLQLVKFPIH